MQLTSSVSVWLRSIAFDVEGLVKLITVISMHHYALMGLTNGFRIHSKAVYILLRLHYTGHVLLMDRVLISNVTSARFFPHRFAFHQPLISHANACTRALRSASDSHSISLSISLLSPGGSESSWDKEKLQSPPPPPEPSMVWLTPASPLSTACQGLISLPYSRVISWLTVRLDLPFMMMPHPLLPVSLPPASVAMAMNQMNHLNTIANMAAAAQMHSPLSRAGASVIKECVQDSPSPAPSLEETPRPGSQPSSHPSSSVSSSPNPHTQSPERLVLNPTDGELPERDTGINMKKILKEKG
ncbi:hypothetical protein H4Q32_019063 [Labeo rohita]|uniref:Dachshund-like protein n=1 Tax=Labeo rohita TaxID=84645 RepID=A0ABQ8LM72_LABRO|nr:hypothetical protein H4Q32_019063 [Labeo rohita]